MRVPVLFFNGLSEIPWIGADPAGPAHFFRPCRPAALPKALQRIAPRRRPRL